MRKLILLSFLFFSCGYLVQAETYELTLEQSIEIAKRQNYSMLNLQQDLKISEFNLKSAKSRLRTNIEMVLNLPQYDETVRQKADSTGVFFSVKELTYSSGLTINQPLLTDGNIFVQSGLATYRDYYAGTRSSNLNTRIGFRQPLDALYGYSAIKTSLKTAELGYESSNKALKRQELRLVLEVSELYYGLLSGQRRLEIARLDLERQTEAYEISKNKYEAGLIREVDALQMEVDLVEAQSSYEEAKQSQYVAMNAFKKVLALPFDSEIIVSDKMNYDVVIVDPEQAVQFALENRTEIREHDIDIELQKLAITRQKTEGKIRGELGAYYEKFGFAGSGTDLNIGHSINNSYNNFIDRPSSFGVSLSITIPIFDSGVNRSLVNAAKARLIKAEYDKEDTKDQIEVGVRNLVANISTNLKRLQVLEKNVAVAEKSFEITRQRYSDGDIDSQALSLERNRLNGVYINHLNAYISYRLGLANLMGQTFYDFEKGELIQ